VAYDFHSNKSTYFNMQYKNAKEFVLPFVEEVFPVRAGMQVLEIGSAEAGVLKAFTERGCQCTGIELQPSRVKLAEEFMAKELAAGKIRFIARDIYDIDIDADLGNKFDLIILKDVIEHIHDQERFIAQVGNFLNEGGRIFYGFPPWYMPFGGHQQIAQSKLLSKLPYYHLLPMPLYKLVLKAFGESEKRVDDLVEIKETGISIERFERLNKKRQFSSAKKRFYFINPIYSYKFGLQPREQSGFLAAIPFVRNFLTTAVYYLMEKEKS